MDKQKLAIERIKGGDNIFLTGAGGTGKSYVINQILDDSTLLCAPTGIAAINVNGITCHKAFGLPLGVAVKRHQRIDRIADETFRTLFSGDEIKRIIIDEVSMLRRDMFELIDAKLKLIKGNDLPFGGIQMVVVGDFLQLEPIVPTGDMGFYQRYYDSVFSFTSDAWVFDTIELDKVYRQEDQEQVNILNSIRKGKDVKQALNAIKKLSKPFIDSPTILQICTLNRDVDAVNNRWYSELKTPEYTYQGLTVGNWKPSEMPSPLKLKLKKGARVMLTANDPDGRYVNGDRGIVEELSHGAIKILLDRGKSVTVSTYTWRKVSYKRVGGKLVKTTGEEYMQYPVKLAYAVSIHKSQGMTVTDLAVDVGERGCFAHGQLYVALSRITDLRELQLVRPISEKDLIIKQEVLDFYG